ncbi:hypothetical protein ACMD2_12383, partial [Ananas comosus]
RFLCSARTCVAFEHLFLLLVTHLALVIFIHNLVALQVQHLNCRAHYDWI